MFAQERYLDTSHVLKEKDPIPRVHPQPPNQNDPKVGGWTISVVQRSRMGLWRPTTGWWYVEVQKLANRRMIIGYIPIITHMQQRLLPSPMSYSYTFYFLLYLARLATHCRCGGRVHRRRQWVWQLPFGSDAPCLRIKRTSANSVLYDLAVQNEDMQIKSNQSNIQITSNYKQMVHFCKDLPKVRIPTYVSIIPTWLRPLAWHSLWHSVVPPPLRALWLWQWREVATPATSTFGRYQISLCRINM